MKLIKMAVYAVWLMLIGTVSVSVSAQVNKSVYVPAPLEPWVDWVLHDENQLDCPYGYNSQVRYCTWPSRLDLRLTDSGGRFTQQWEVFSDTLVQLPGEAKHWPLRVFSNNKSVLVESSSGVPYVRLGKGKHTLTGEFRWSKLPESLFITPGTGLVDLSINDQPVASPRFDKEGQLWLLQSNDEKVSEDNIDMQVFRRIYDGHPIRVETLIKLRVSGKQRNGILNAVLLHGFVAAEIRSDLPSRMEGGDRLMVQLRPGEWSISVTGRAPADVQTFTMPEAKEPWPQQEIWVFVNDNTMRQVQVEGVTSIDPSQTRLPDAWKGLPAYLLKPSQTLRLDVKERGINNLARSELILEREMWLDFDGKGYSIEDQVKGVIEESRINVLPEIELGRVSINEQPQFITRELDSDATGVEVRQKQLNLLAESRFVGKHSVLPANGWEVDFQRVRTRLHLPPGWRVLGISGTDNVASSWLQSWSLLDLFLLMIIVMSVQRFYGLKWAGVALLTLAATWQEGGAPNLIWLNLLAVTALLSVLPNHKFTSWVSKYRLLSLGALAVIMLSYALDTIRVSVYPQLERGYTQRWQSARQLEQDLQQARQETAGSQLDEPLASVAENAYVASKSIPRSRINRYSKSSVDLKQIDPNSMIQSGPGLPTWSGYKTLNLSWAGPVKADQTSRLVLLSPRANFVFKILGLALLLILSWCFIRLPSGDGGDGNESSASFAKLVQRLRSSTAILLVLAMPLAVPDTALAQDMPDRELLNTLKQRLTKAPECLGACAQVQRLSVNLSRDTLQLRLRVHAAADTAIALPASQDTWLPTQVAINAEPASALARDTNNNIWLSLKAGQQDVVLSGPMLRRNSFPLPLPMTPKFSTWRSDDNSWAVEGISDNGVASKQLQFNRIVDSADQQFVQADNNVVPKFVIVERQLRLGLDWYVQTTVRRVAPLNVPLNINIPLLANEQVLDDQLRVERGQAALSLSAGQSQVSWTSKLEASAEMTLTAASNPAYLEVWSVEASPVWGVTAQGLPINRYRTLAGSSAQNSVVPVWQPWPEESLRLSIQRPEGIAGQMVTIQGSKTAIRVGKRVNEVALDMSVRSSRGVQHKIILPEGADVQELVIDAVKQRVQMQDRALSMTLKPGKQDITVKWREPNTQALTYAFPAVDLQLPSVNAHTELSLPRDRWLIWAKGPLLGPAILFWSVLGALLLLSLALGFSRLTPLSSLSWFLLSIGLSQTSPAMIIVVVVCLLGLAVREKLTTPLSRFQFNVMQLGLMLLILASFSIILVAVANGLLGSPDMQVKGNGSNSYFLKWYQDRAAALLPQPEIISVPLWVYRVMMLMWAMWLAMSVLKWIRWGWGALTVGEFWRAAVKPDEGEQAHAASSESTELEGAKLD